jgi:hypothetical protein
MNNRFEIIETPDYILAVSDTAGNQEAYRLEYMPHKPHCYTRIYCNKLKNSTVVLWDKGIWKGEAGFTYEIIAYQPKVNTPELDLPLIPKMVVEDDFEIELKNFDSANILDILNMGNINYLSNGDIVYNPDLLFIKTGEKWFTKNKSATKVYSEKDLRGIAEFAFSFHRRNDLDDVELEIEFNRLLDKNIQSFQQPKTPKWFVAEMQTYPPIITETHIGSVDPYELKTTIIDGKTFLVGTYLYE